MRIAKYRTRISDITDIIEETIKSRTSDINARNYEVIERIPEDILLEVIDIISGFIELEVKNGVLCQGMP